MNLLLWAFISASAVQAFSPATRADSRFIVSSADSTNLFAETEHSTETSEGNDRQLFLDQCRLLCQERNLPLQKVKNARDLASVGSTKIQSGRVFRMGRVSDATQEDLDLLFDELGIRTLIDTRSPTELKDDPTLMREEVFQPFTNIVWKERGKGGVIRELPPGVSPVARRRFRKKKEVAETDLEGDDDEDDELDFDDMQPADTVLDPAQQRKERHFVSLMNEFKYVKGTVSKVRKRDLTKAVLKSPGAIVSRRVRTSVKDPFIEKINDGGLPMLNELLLRFGAPGIKYVLEICADTAHHPVAFYCTAGKDRTGMLAAIILSLCGAEPEDIVEDYMLSANVYAEMNDHQAMVGALSQRNLDPATFLSAPPQVMRDTLNAIEDSYGGVEEYCTWIGFGPDKQEKLRLALCTPHATS